MKTLFGTEDIGQRQQDQLSADCVDALRARGVHTLFAQFTDLHGTVKGKFVPLEQWRTLLETGASFSGPSLAGTGLPRFGACSDYYGRAAAAPTVPLPWLPGHARVVLDGFVAGKPFALCPRQVLKQQVKSLTQRGLTLNVGIEPEFFLFRKRADNNHDGTSPLPLDTDDTLDKPSYHYQTLYRARPFLDDLGQTLTAMGFQLEQIDHEEANGQFEVNYRYDEALAAADRFMLFKMAAHGIAERLGLMFSLMPKPFADQPGSGLHFHLSLTDAQGDQPMTHADGSLSELGRHFLGGLLAHAPALTALCAPTVNSYKRLNARDSRSGCTCVPQLALYGDNNRTTLARIVAGRIEWRVPDGTCNPYLALAAVLAAGLDGLDNAIDPGPPTNLDVGDALRDGRLDQAPQLPTTLAEALAALEADAALRAALSPALCEQFLRIKQNEWLSYHARISAWEYEHTLSRH